MTDSLVAITARDAIEAAAIEAWNTALAEGATDAHEAIDVILQAAFAARVPVPCQECDATGLLIYGVPFEEREPCPACSGSGTIPGELALVRHLIDTGVLERWPFASQPVYLLVDTGEQKP